jgi:hypothetical protein
MEEGSGAQPKPRQRAPPEPEDSEAIRGRTEPAVEATVAAAAREARPIRHDALPLHFLPPHTRCREDHRPHPPLRRPLPGTCARAQAATAPLSQFLHE